MMSYTKDGATKSVSSDWFNRKKNYTKVNLSQQQIQNYKLMMSLGIGVKLLSAEQSEGRIQMQGGHTIKAIVQNSIVGKEGLNLIWKSLLNIRYILLENEIAHTDIKPSNIAVKFFSTDLKTFKVFLIDNDEIKTFGQVREVGTPDFNCYLPSLQSRQIVDQNTDRMGFENLKRYMRIL